LLPLNGARNAVLLHNCLEQALKTARDVWMFAAILQLSGVLQVEQNNLLILLALLNSRYTT